MINYIIQVILFQVLFLAMYDLFLSKETFFTKNRFYLLGTAIISFVLPLVHIPTLQKAIPQEYVIWLPEVVLSPQKVIEQSAWYENINYVQLLFWVGVVVFFILFVVKLISIIRLLFNHEIHPKKNYKLVWLPKNAKAFSFFNYIFLGKEIPQEQKAKIIAHELVHSEQKHTLDLLFFELLKIVMWFNPMVYVYQNRIALVHEFISDDVATKQTSTTNYINSLLSEIFQVEQIAFINQFYKQSLLKKRIMMLTKNKSNSIQQLKYLLLVPVLASMLLYTACTSNEEKVDLKSTKQPVTVYKNEDGKIVSEVSSGYQSKYLDLYLGKDFPTTKEYSVNELTNEERAEYEAMVKKFNEGPMGIDIKIFEAENGRKMVAFGKPKLQKKGLDKLVSENGDVPFSIIEKAPTFPGCADGDKDCFNKSMRNFVKENFNASLANSLGLSSGKKRLFIKFKIDKSGKIKDIDARAPHPELKQEAIRLAEKLPTFKNGVHNGKPVTVGYVLPITFVVE